MTEQTAQDEPALQLFKDKKDEGKFEKAIAAATDHFTLSQEQTEGLCTVTLQAIAEQDCPFQTIVVLIADPFEVSLIKDADILDCEVAKGCYCSTCSVGYNSNSSPRCRFYFCSANTFSRLRKKSDLDEWEAMNKLPPLIGSQKQVAWARVLRFRQLPIIRGKIAEFEELYPDIHEALKLVLRDFESMQDVSAWINQKESPFTAMILHRAGKYRIALEKLNQPSIKLEDDSPRARLIYAAKLHHAKHSSFDVDGFMRRIDKYLATEDGISDSRYASLARDIAATNKWLRKGESLGQWLKDD